jgi:hypothetical protein
MAPGIQRLGNVTVPCQRRCMTDDVALHIGQQHLTSQRPKLKRWLRYRTNFSCEPSCDPMRGLQIVFAGTGKEKLNQFRSAVAEVGEGASVQLARHLRLEAVDEFIINVALPPPCGRYLGVDGADGHVAAELPRQAQQLQRLGAARGPTMQQCGAAGPAREGKPVCRKA